MAYSFTHSQSGLAGCGSLQSFLYVLDLKVDRRERIETRVALVPQPADYVLDRLAAGGVEIGFQKSVTAIVERPGKIALSGCKP